MKSIFVVFVQEKDGKYFAVADTIRTGQNLIPYTQRYNSDICHLCESRKQAEEIATFWNACFREKGTNLI